ncbi:substrate-binding domain-containing protein [Nodularia spumigena]|uniref:substrate-binding domain-containing protein n=1 Tax=Nodularia spumigena TaxID=70799 RepID=UPI00232ECC27|nr:substrate-binding domain-containing protein [Nodularia spumigena]MDB9317000.1 substrate-binding domain-containing protein [Nodularia spumigena CS-590/01A]MDB9323957.1 substrate-binding domain-containing protein [Nodularia spumigena CS-591/07A]MDB9325424.1 substrate-binding domain-containing protein [Nodularia spumigena CS-590/02]MDB9332458.1 substrate-binding domain-containing protein [Nodularia spumigena CS-591/04]MDB9335062.1 substrate-binding domain-containing protein [Nodularia spumigen
MQIKDKQPVEIKEYLLPNRCFNEQEIQQRKQIFQRIGGVKLADSRIQNFRLVKTWEPIADENTERCYLITQGIEASQTLGQYLAQKGKMTASQVRDVLKQTLQTLEFLHSQKISFPSNQVQEGMAHGNINLDSILIKVTKNQQFFLYLCDLAIWENLFIPPAIPQSAPAQKENDLESLGLVAFYLLSGRTLDHGSNQPLNPRDTQQWSTTDNHLKQFIEQLMGFRTPFISAESARQALMKLPKDGQEDNSSQLAENETATQGLKKWSILLLIIILLLMGGGIAYYLLLRKGNVSENFDEWNGRMQHFFVDVNVDNKLRGNKFSYTGEQLGTWSLIINQIVPIDNSTLKELLANPNPDAKMQFQYAPVISNLENTNEPVAAVERGDKDFAITSLTKNVSDKLEEKPVAYDGLLVYVEFNSGHSKIANELGGKITLEQLRKIYTGKITNWQQINSNLPDLEIRPFAPDEPEAISKFKEIVLKNHPEDNPSFPPNVTIQATKTTQNQIREEILNSKVTGIISFGIISKIKGQCSGYPLAIVDGKKQAIQPLFQKRDRRSINTSDDLCDHDNYFFDVKTFHQYPLAYPIFVVYRKDNRIPPAGSTFAEILTTRQGQCLLSKVGLVPLQPIPDDINNYACKSLPKPNL